MFSLRQLPPRRGNRIHGGRGEDFDAVDCLDMCFDSGVALEILLELAGGLSTVDVRNGHYVELLRSLVFARSGNELQKQTPPSRAETQLGIGELHIKECLERHHSQKLQRKTTEERDVQATDEPRDLSSRR